MKTLNLVILFALSIFLISNASAVVLTGLWQNGAASMTIIAGNSSTFTVDFGSMHPPISITESLYNLNDQLIWQNSRSGLSSGFVTDTIPASYLSAGSYQLIINGNDANNFPDSDTLTLQVNSPQPPIPVNGIPVITSTPVTSVNESIFYSYPVIANDSNGDVLVYSLTQAPTWLSINAATGLILGTAPSVASDTNFAVTVMVSDGVNSTSQGYLLTVRDITNPTPNPNQTLTIQFVSPTPSTGSNFYRTYIPTEVSVTSTNAISSIRVYLYDSSRSIVAILNPGNLQQADFTGLAPGTYYINATVLDVFGNQSSTETRAIGLLAGNNNSYLVSNYTYHDVYSNYNPQTAKTQPEITISSENQKGSNAYSLLLIIFETLLIIVVLVLIVLVFSRRKFTTEIEPPKTFPVKTYKPKPSDDLPLY